MEEIKISVPTLIGFGIGAFFGWFMPLIMWIVWRKKKHTAYFPFISGIVAYILISLVRMVVRIIFLRGVLRNHFTDGLISGVCEEVGRFLVFRYALYEYKDPKNAVSYGIGHGGWEMFIVYGLNGLSSPALITGLAYTILGMEKYLSYGDLTYEQANETLSSLAEMNIGTSIMSVIDAFSGMTFHIALSVLVFIAVHSENWKKYLLSAVAIHTISDFLAAQLFGSQTSIERMIFGLCETVGVIYFVYMVYQKYTEENVYADHVQQ